MIKFLSIVLCVVFCSMFLELAFCYPSSSSIVGSEEIHQMKKRESVDASAGLPLDVGQVIKPLTDAIKPVENVVSGLTGGRKRRDTSGDGGLLKPVSDTLGGLLG